MAHYYYRSPPSATAIIVTGVFIYSYLSIFEPEVESLFKHDTMYRMAKPVLLKSCDDLADQSLQRGAELGAQLLDWIGEDISREGLEKTPQRWAEALKEMTEGYCSTPAEVVGDALFSVKDPGLVVVKDIQFFSLCEHHILPFFGSVKLAYLPDKKVLGLSKLPRIVELYSRRLQMQERLTSEIVTAIDELVSPQGVACRIEAQHMCCAMRGVRSTDSRMITEVLKGVFEYSEVLQARWRGL